MSDWFKIIFENDKGNTHSFRVSKKRWETIEELVRILHKRDYPEMTLEKERETV